MDEILKHLAKEATVEHAARETPNAANQVQYPAQFHNCVPVITAHALQPLKLPTIIIATQSKGYPKESFESDVQKTREYFELVDGVFEAILLKPVAEGLDVLDSADAIKEMRRVVDLMNQVAAMTMGAREQDAHAVLPSGIEVHILATLRIVSLGVKTSKFIFQALEYMLNHWAVPKKNIQFVTNGEIGAAECLKFWSSACVNKLCENVQYINLSDYLPFGYQKGKCKKLCKT